MPPKSEPTSRWASGASCASRRSTAIPPNHENIEPPRNACARLLIAMPFWMATSLTSSLSASPRDGNALFITTAEANIPAQKPSLNRRSARKSRMPAGYPAATSMAAMEADDHSRVARGCVSRRDVARRRGSNGRRRPLPGDGRQLRLRRPPPPRSAPPRQRRARRAARRRLHPRASDQDERNGMKTSQRADLRRHRRTSPWPSS